ncbi:hypothetical protein LOTGIDRAFT_162775 [Lottia gigantea]|uniref:Uncharacterized protein n=1 Tax=Lottia gigantea TaxID=225164 RepID=V4BST0_LOTGI|nr:hypothetical protein LOTGIDRAFT_162775 [Lottia gigantea]ESO92124.1 hypothetical protein LOTGIDRAFT_162775 [Lottia gigantea]
MSELVLVIRFRLEDLIIKVDFFRAALDGGCVASLGRICGCFNPSNTTHSIECCGDEIMQLELTGETIIYQRTDSTCKPSSVTVPCVTSENRYRLDHEDKVNIYNNCSGQKRCDVHLQTFSDIKIQITVTCEPANRLFSKIETYPLRFTNKVAIFYINGKDYIGKEITKYCTAWSTNDEIYLEVLYINLGPRSCEKVKLSNLKLVCTDSGVTMFYTAIGLTANRSNIDVVCHGSKKDVTERPSPSPSPSPSSSPEGTCKDEDETNPYIMFGSILAAVIVINIVCIGVYCYIRYRKTPNEITTNVAYSNREDSNYDYSHNNYLHVTDNHVIDYEQLPA